MGLFDKKRDHRVPDLSRYSSYYENQSKNNSRSNSLSNSAAASALRTQSLTSSTNRCHQFSDLRTPSLRNYDQPRLNSLNSRSNSLNSRSHSLRGSNKPIIIHTTRTTDEYGRTKSITTETIERFGSFELIKKETQELHPTSRAPNYAGSLLSNELTSIQEEEEPRRQIKTKPRSILKNVPVKEVDSDDESMYSDAFETAPWERRIGFKKLHDSTINPTPRIPKKSSTTSLNAQNAPKRQQMSESEMYARAMEIAKEKVYGSQEKPVEPTPTTFKRYSLRDPKPKGLQQPQQQEQHELLQPQPPPPITQRKTSISSFDSQNSQRSGIKTSKLFQNFKPFRKSKKVEDPSLDSLSQPQIHQHKTSQESKAVSPVTTVTPNEPLVPLHTENSPRAAELPRVHTEPFQIMPDSQIPQNIDHSNHDSTIIEEPEEEIPRVEGSRDDMNELSEVDEGFQTPSEEPIIEGSIVEQLSTPLIRAAESIGDDKDSAPKVAPQPIISPALERINKDDHINHSILYPTTMTNNPTQDYHQPVDNPNIHHDSPSQSSQIPPTKLPKKSSKKLTIGKIFTLLFKKELD